MVETILDGSVRKAGNRLRVTAQLVNTRDSRQLWSERYDRDMDDVFAVQDDIARAVVENLKVRLVGTATTPVVKRTTDNLDAYTWYLKGRHYLLGDQTREALAKSLECFTHALAEDATYAQAHAGTAQSYALNCLLSFASPKEAVPKAKAAALRALGIDETVGDAHSALANVLHWYDWDWPGAEREYRRALEINPGDSAARSHFAAFLALCLGRKDEATAEARRAIEVDPLSVFSSHLLVVVQLLSRRFDAALQQARRTIELAPTYALGYWDLAWAMVALGRHQDAVAALRQADDDGLPTEAYLALACGLAGRKDEALQIIDKWERRMDTFRSGVLMALAYIGVGEHGRAIDWLLNAYEERDGLLMFANNWWVFDPLRADPRFQSLLRRMNFPETTDSG